MKFKYLLSALALTAATVSPASAAFFIDGIGTVGSVAANNDFAGDLSANYSYTLQSNDFGGISLTAPARITFYALASESGYTDTFSGYGVNGVESNFSFDASRVLGSAIVGAGGLTDLNFTSNLGTSGGPGSAQFAIFLPTGFSGSTFNTDWLVFGFDDTVGGDADFDDFIIGAQISPIPEPQMWALIIAGFGLVGLQLRRGRRAGSRAIAC